MLGSTLVCISQVLGQDDSKATFYATLVNSFITVFGVAGGLLADLSWGKLKVQASTSWVWMAGVLLLLLAVATPSHKFGGGGNTDSSTGPAPSVPVLLLSAAGLLLLCAGYGAQQPSQTSFIGEQASTDTQSGHANTHATTETPNEKAPLLALGHGGLAPHPEPPPHFNQQQSGATTAQRDTNTPDPAQHSSDHASFGTGAALSVAAFYSWFYFWENFGAVLGETVCPLLRQHVSFESLFACVLACQIAGLIALLSARNQYNIVPPEHAVVFQPKASSSSAAAADPGINAGVKLQPPATAYHWCTSQYCSNCPRLIVLLCGATDDHHKQHISSSSFGEGRWVVAQPAGGALCVQGKSIQQGDSVQLAHHDSATHLQAADDPARALDMSGSAENALKGGHDAPTYQTSASPLIPTQREQQEFLSPAEAHTSILCGGLCCDSGGAGRGHFGALGAHAAWASVT